MQYYLLNSDEVKRQIGVLDLKRWWVAEQAGIHRTTLRRWLSGQIHRISENHVIDLAKVLAVSPAVIAYPPAQRINMPST